MSCDVPNFSGRAVAEDADLKGVQNHPINGLGSLRPKNRFSTIKDWDLTTESTSE